MNMFEVVQRFGELELNLKYSALRGKRAGFEVDSILLYYTDLWAPKTRHKLQLEHCNTLILLRRPCSFGGQDPRGRLFLFNCATKEHKNMS